MKKILLVSFLSLFSFAICPQLYGQAAGNAVYSNTTPYNANVQMPRITFLSDTVMLLSADVLMNVPANSYTLIIGASQVAENLEQCNTLLNERLAQLTQGVKRLGIDDKNVNIDFISQVPVFEYDIEKKLFSKTYNEVPRGFELKKNVHINYARSEQLDDILTIAAQSEIYDIVKVDYVVDNIEAVYDSLRVVAVRVITKKAESYRKLGIKFDRNDYQLVAEDSRSSYPSERYKTYTAYNPPSLSAVKKGTVVNAPKSQTIYYDKIPNNDFDAVINSKVIEPVAQFMYSVQVKYVLKKQ